MDQPDPLLAGAKATIGALHSTASADIVAATQLLPGDTSRPRERSPTRTGRRSTRFGAPIRGGTDEADSPADWDCIAASDPGG